MNDAQVFIRKIKLAILFVLAVAVVIAQIVNAANS